MNQKILQITAGRGPAECCWVVAQVLKYCIEALKKAGLTYEILQRVPGIENGTIRSVTLQLKGQEVVTFAQSWIGTIQWIGTSNFRKHHKRKNWFIAVYELSAFQVKDLAMKDVVFQTMRSSGPGGQHVNKVSSAVRATHLPTGSIVVVTERRSQHQNKKIAVQRLKAKVIEAQLAEVQQGILNQWENTITLQRGNPVKVFKGTDFKRKKKEQSFKNQRSQLKKALRNELKQ